MTTTGRLGSTKAPSKSAIPGVQTGARVAMVGSLIHISRKASLRISGASLKASTSRPVNLNKVINGVALALIIEDTDLHRFQHYFFVVFDKKPKLIFERRE
jgi:hypothetical protein